MIRLRPNATASQAKAGLWYGDGLLIIGKSTGGKISNKKDDNNDV